MFGEYEQRIEKMRGDETNAARLNLARKSEPNTARYLLYRHKTSPLYAITRKNAIHLFRWLTLVHLPKLLGTIGEPAIPFLAKTADKWILEELP